MKKLLLLLVAFALLGGYVQRASGALLAYEGFDYPGGSYPNSTFDIQGQNGGFGWAGAWDYRETLTPAGSQSGATATSSPIITSSLTYTDAVGNVLITAGNKLLNSGTNRVTQAFNGQSRPARELTNMVGSVDGSTTWISFLGQRIGDPDVSGFRDAGANLTFFDTNVWSANTGGQFAIGENSGTAAGQTNDTWGVSPLGAGSRRRTSTNYINDAFTNKTLIVMRINNHDDGLGHTATPTVANCDDLYIWLNPTNLAVEPPLVSAMTNILATDTSNTGGVGFDLAFNEVLLFAGPSTAGARSVAEWYVDEIRIGTTYADVVPYTPSAPVNLKTRWTNVVATGSSISLTLTGKVSTLYRVVGATNLTQSPWNVIGNLTTDANGVGVITDTGVLVTQPRRFYGVDVP